jgi:hypothetical protein
MILFLSAFKLIVTAIGICLLIVADSKRKRQ